MNKNLVVISFVGISILIILILSKIYNQYYISYEGFEDKKDAKKEPELTSNGIIKVKRPFVNIYDDKGRALNVLLLSKPFSGDKEYNLLKEYQKKYIIVGISSYLEFPNMVTNPYEDFTENYKKYKYKEQCEGWIHCFRDPEKYFPPSMPTLFASESDWTDCNFLTPNKKDPPKKIYDFIYICLKVKESDKKCDDWATWNKNWALAKKCLSVFCKKFKLKGLLVGRKNCPLGEGCDNLMETTEMVKYSELKKLYEKSKFLFLPNLKDASPRVLTEALSLNLPVLVNENILGGWKYVNEQTGEFFKDENDVGDKVKLLMNNIANHKYEPRKSFVENYGTHNSSEKLKKFLYDNWGDKINIPKDDIEYLVPEFNRKKYKKCEV